MVDINLFYKLLKVLPEKIQLLLVGDPYQLPPIGPGLLFHELVKYDFIPQARLTIIKRQSTQTGIPQFSWGIRMNTLPPIKKYNNQVFGVSCIACPPDEIEGEIVALYKSFSPIVLSPTRNGIAGVNSLNKVLQRLNKGKCIRLYDEINEHSIYRNKFGHQIKINDSVMNTKNDYSSTLRNGSLGLVKQTFICTSPVDPACVVDFEGEEHTLSYTDLDHLELAYAITVHKSQGSQFDKVVIPIRESKVLDHSLIYTAVTRAVTQVVFVGDMNVLKRAVESHAKVWNRVTAIKEHFLT